MSSYDWVDASRGEVVLGSGSTLRDEIVRHGCTPRVCGDLPSPVSCHIRSCRGNEGQLLGPCMVPVRRCGEICYRTVHGGRRLTSSPVMSQYRRCGRTDGGASIEESVVKTLSDGREFRGIGDAHVGMSSSGR